jgi:cytochrome P450
MEPTGNGVLCNACDPRLRDDPYPRYKRLRHVEPIHRTPYGHWAVSGYSAVASLIRSARLTSEYPQDPVPIDLMGSPAAPVPVTVFRGPGGPPVADRDLRRNWTDALGHVIGPATDETAPRAVIDAAEECGAYAAEHLAGRRADPRDDVNSRPGSTIPCGSEVMIPLGAAHRDPRRHPAPDRLDLRRRAVRPLSFGGGGPQYRIGAMPAETEARPVRTEPLRRYRAVDLAREDLIRRPQVTLRGSRQLSVDLVS